jgi:hypothetical protein
MSHDSGHAVVMGTSVRTNQDVKCHNCKIGLINDVGHGPKFGYTKIIKEHPTPD